MAGKDRPGRAHKDVVADAGFRRLSLVSTLAGTLTGYGAFAVLAAVIGAVYSAADVDTDFRTNDWNSTEAAGAVATAATLFLAYLFGGYVAGRMARRAGILHGLAVFVLGLLGGAVVGGLVAGLGDDDAVRSNLRSIGVPTELDQWGDVGRTTAAAALALMLAGAVLGGMLGERWHTKLARRAADPAYGPAAEGPSAQPRTSSSDGRTRSRSVSQDVTHIERSRTTP